MNQRYFQQLFHKYFISIGVYSNFNHVYVSFRVKNQKYKELKLGRYCAH